MPDDNPRQGDAEYARLLEVIRGGLNAVTGRKELEVIAKKVGVQAATLYNIRNGRFAPNLRTAFRLARALNYTLTLRENRSKP